MIGNKLSRVVSVDVGQDGLGWGKFLKVQVSINVFLPLRKAMKFFYESDHIEIDFQYDLQPIGTYRKRYLKTEIVPITNPGRIEEAKGTEVSEEGRR
ncbi:hypothetical protein ACH5RR_000911 [Cinchona calisaya]|uniref:Uncharacterized protein n=1 Tax=Cinchona calisaya TaxID=153742 RepID=A0ABD3B2G5_9GENT